ncbi:MAG: hypothetical protein LBV17_03260 [Treponema sp.]|jgi:tRNA (cmo5U34)-methyltransferase|nr:hypothetical protein [Treponema sp.]
MDRIKTVKDHFEEEADEFDKIILKLIPHYTEMIEALVMSIPFERDRLKTAKCIAFCKTCSTTNRVAEQVKYMK